MPTDIALTALACRCRSSPRSPARRSSGATAPRGSARRPGAEAIVLSTLIATHTQALKIANGSSGADPHPDRVRPGRRDARAPGPGPVRARARLSSEIIVGQWHGLPFTPSIQQMRECGADHPDDRGGRAGELRGQVLSAQELPARDFPPRRRRRGSISPRWVPACASSRARWRTGAAQLDPPSAVPASVRHVRPGQARGPEPGRRGRRGVRAHLRGPTSPRRCARHWPATSPATPS